MGFRVELKITAPDGTVWASDDEIDGDIEALHTGMRARLGAAAGSFRETNVVQQIFYFGTWRDSGHYLWKPGMVKPRRTEEETEAGKYWMPKGCPWTHIDGGLNPVGEIEGEALLHHASKDDVPWTAIGFANRTDDSRGGCNGNFLIKGALLDFDRAVEVSKEHFPDLFEHWPFELRQVSKPARRP